MGFVQFEFVSPETMLDNDGLVQQPVLEQGAGAVVRIGVEFLGDLDQVEHPRR
jgi:hypothetical protein